MHYATFSLLRNALSIHESPKIYSIGKSKIPLITKNKVFVSVKVEGSDVFLVEKLSNSRNKPGESTLSPKEYYNKYKEQTKFYNIEDVLKFLGGIH